MSKRIATSELNHDNWNDKDEPEEKGTFKKASPDVLQKRVIKSAKRRSTGVSDSPGTFTDSPDAKRSPFSGLGGFKMTSTSSSPFSFLNRVKDNNISSPAMKNGSSSNIDFTIKKDVIGSSLKTSLEGSANVKAKDTDPKIEEKSSDYYSKLKGLNESVSDWIRLHVNKNPFCILTPIFKDYEQYLEEIEKNDNSSGKATVKDSKNPFPSDFSKSSSLATASTMFSRTAENETSKPSIMGSSSCKPADKTPTFKFGSTEDRNKSGTQPFNSLFANAEPPSKTETFPKKVTEVSSPGTAKDKDPLMVNPFTSSGNKTPFFGTSTSTPASVGFSFGSGSTSAAGSTNVKTDDEDYQPPKPEFIPVQEEGAAYSKRCKVFVRKDSSYQERGVGNLFLKPVEEKTQLIVRADTSIGNLLMNCLLNSSMSPQKMGANNVMLVCLPTPESKPPPVPVLLKVKTSEDADELLAKLKEYIDNRK